RIEFEDGKKFTTSILDDVKFMTISCKFRVTAQRRFLEGKYPSYLIYLKDLYAVIQSFHPTSKSLSNDTVQVSNWLDQQKAMDSH
ncbi:3683_t:CDS:2, partial [Funneliformis mosseae]